VGNSQGELRAVAQSSELKCVSQNMRYENDHGKWGVWGCASLPNPSRRLPIWQLYERARSLGLAVQVSSQSWQGLAADEDDRYRIAAAADGGIWLLRTPHPEPITGLAGARRAVDTSRRLLGVPRWSHQGSSRVRDTPVADPALIRGLAVGQAAYIYRGGVTYVQVKRLVAAPAALAGQPAPPRRAAAPQDTHERAGAGAAPAVTGAGQEQPEGAAAPSAATGAAGYPPLPDATELLDEAFGGDPG
jgi:hypothetical protein